MSLNKQQDFMFNYLVSDFPKEKQATLNMMYARSRMIDEYNHRHEMEQMEKRITANVLKALSIKFETDDALNEIKSLNKAIEDLGGNK